MNVLRAAVIGIGNMGRHHARIYSELEGVELIALADSNIHRGREAAGKLGVEFYQEYNEMLDRVKPDLVSIAVPTSFHVELGRNVLSRGVSCLIEKPLAPTSQQALDLSRVASCNGAILAVGHVERFNPAVRALNQLVLRGTLGDILSITSKRVGMIPPRIKDANVVLDLAIHDIDLLNCILQMVPDAMEITAGSGLLGDQLDHCEIFLRYGSIGCFVQANWVTPLKVRELAVTGTKGYAELNYVTQSLNLYRANLERSYDTFGEFVIKFGTPRSESIPVQVEEPLKLEIMDFVSAVRGGPSRHVSGEQAAQAIAVVEQALARLSEVAI